MQDWLFHTQYRSHLLLWLLMFTLWSPAIYDGYIQLDTKWLVVDNPILQNRDIGVLKQIWVDMDLGTRLTLGAEYLPLRDLTVWLDWMLFGEEWKWHHFHSLFWYGLSCSILLEINQCLFGRNIWAWLGALVFMIHPTHVESVVWLASRKDVLSLAFGLLACLRFLKGGSHFQIALLLLMAYWSKNTAIVWGPILVLFSLFWKRENPFQKTWWFSWLPSILVLGAGLILTLKVGTMVSMFAEPRGKGFETLNIAAQTWCKYAEMLVFPNHLSLFYAEPNVESWLHPKTTFGIFVGLFLILAPIFTLKKYPLLSIGMWTIPLGLLPVSQLTPIQNLMADRYLLIPTIGLSWIVTSLTTTQFKSLKMVGILAPLLFIPLTHTRIPLFTNELDLWRDVIRKEPREIRGWTTLASIYRESEDFEQSAEILNQADKQFPMHPKIDLAWGMWAMNIGETEIASERFLNAWKKDDTLREAANNYSILQQKTQPKQAITVSEQLVKKHPLYAKGWDTYGSTCLQTLDLDCAEKAFQQAIHINPYNPRSLANMGTLYYLKEDWIEARYWWQRTVGLEPNHTYALQGLMAIENRISDVTNP